MAAVPLWSFGAGFYNLFPAAGTVLGRWCSSWPTGSRRAGLAGPE
jgi:hypothetical protein